MQDIRSVLSSVQQDSLDKVVRLNNWTRGWLLILYLSFRQVFSFQSSMTAAATAYFTFFSIFPMVLLTIVIASFWLDPLAIGEEILSNLEFVVPAINELLGANLEEIVRARGTITRLSALTLIWSSSSAIYMLIRALDSIWPEKETRSAWRHRALAIVLTLAISVTLWIGSFAWSVVVPIMNRLLPDSIYSISPYLSWLGTALFSVFVFTVLYLILPYAKLRIRDVIYGAVIAGVLWEIAKRGFLFFIGNYLTATNLLYGSLTAIIAFLVWVYISSLIFLFGAHVNVRYRQLRQSR